MSRQTASPPNALRRSAARAWLIAWLALVAAPVAALDPQLPFRNYTLDRWGVEEGLPQITVLSITQDREGYLWVGTQNGIARFDGLRFEVYDVASSGVDTTMATAALVDRDNRAWFATPRGVLRIHGDAVADIRAVDEDLLSVNALAERADGQLLLATGNGVMTVRDGVMQPLWLAGEATQALLAEDDQVWVGGHGVLWRISASGQDRISMPSAELEVTHIARSGPALWLGTRVGLLRYVPESGSLSWVAPEISGLAVESLAADRDGNVWVGTTDPLVRVRPDGSVEVVSESDFARQPWIHAIYEDREGDLWLGSHRDSLVRARNSASTYIGPRDGLAEPFVWSLLRDTEGRLLIGTNAGLYARDAAGALSQLLAADALPQGAVYTMALDRDRSVWIGTRSGLFTWRAGRLDFPSGMAELAPLQINALHRMGDGEWWIGTMGGLYRFHEGALSRIGPAAGSAAARIRCILALDGGDLLVGTEAGIRRVHAGRFETLPWGAPLEGAFVARIGWIRPGLLGITTNDSGLGLSDGEHLMMLTTAQGLPSRNGWSLDVVGGHLYVASIHGAYRIALDDLPDPAGPLPPRIDAPVVVEPVGAAHSMRRLGCCNGGADARTLRDGRYLWFASTGGAVRLDTEAIPDRPTAPHAVVEQLRRGAERHRRGATVRLEGQPRDLAIDYTGLGLIEPTRVVFRYRLEGYDREWQDAGTRRTAFYTHLPPGELQFTVQARYPEGEWSAPAEAMRIEIAPMWHERGLVRTLVALLLLALFVLAWRAHLAQLRRRQAILERAVAERTAELARANDRLHAANEALALESQTDALTGLYNRRHLIGTELRAGRPLGERDAVLLLDVDHFKRVNDQHGHTSGDRVLVELSSLLLRSVRGRDSVTRWGGEEFLLLLRDIDEARALELAERVRHEIAVHAFHAMEGQALALTCSIGVAMHPVHPAVDDWRFALDLADAALYNAKRSGRDRVVALLATPQATARTLLANSPVRVEELLASGQLDWRRPVTSA